LRLQAAERAVATMLADLGRDGARIAVAARMDERRGQLVRVTVGGAPAAARAALEQALGSRLAPLTIAHEIAWE
ncbi:MAG: acyl-CoA synthetase, partial [Burkholderiales bacterium]|nr:acyl-CoA synthetase [Burkholderiales bacterium]